MKTINEYINESLFDSEDDLLEKDPQAYSLDWLIKRQIKKYGATDSYDKNRNLFKTLYKNNIKYLQVSSWEFIRIYDNYITYGV